MNESVADRAVREAEISRAKTPDIVEMLKRGEELHAVAEQVSNETGVSSISTYRWVHEIDSVIQRRRKTIAILGAACMWVSVFLLILAILLPFVSDASSVVYFILAGSLAVPAVVLSLGARRIAFGRGYHAS